MNKNKALLDLPKIGEVKFHYSRPIEGEIKNATISKINNEWFVSFCCEKEIEVKKNEQSAIGIDLGVKRTIAISEENIYSDSDCNLPEKIKTIEKMIARSQRKLSKRKKFGKNWFKLKKKINGLHRTITRIRRDFLHKISTKIAKNHGTIVLENLKVKNMSASAKGTLEDPGKNVQAKSGLNRSILRQGWGIFANFLEYKSVKFGSVVAYIPPAYTSQTCSKCFFKHAENRVTRDWFCCQSCNHKEDADTNAAKVIKTLGLRGNACGGWDKGLAVETGTSENLQRSNSSERSGILLL